ncbi:MAG: diguanylate cyclase [Burkholderiales bacterium]
MNTTPRPAAHANTVTPPPPGSRAAVAALGASAVGDAQDSPANVARQAIKDLARKKLPPTPENFSRAYGAILGEKPTPLVAPASGASVAVDAEPMQLLRMVVELVGRSAGKDLALTAALDKGDFFTLEALLRSILERRGHPSSSGGYAAVSNDWAETTASALSCSSPIYRRTPELKAKAGSLLHNVRYISAASEHGELRNKFREFMGELAEEQAAGEQENQQLKSLLSAVAKNVASLSAEHGWLSGQMSRLDEALADGASAQTLRQVEASLRDASRRQSAIKRQLDEAKASIRDLISVFMDRLGAMASSTGQFAGKLSTYTTAIESARDINDITQVVSQLLAESRGIEAEMLSSNSELAEARATVARHESRAAELERELIKVSELVKTDNLTRTLNRNGLDAAFAEEAERMSSTGESLCLAVLDIDNFKGLNDKLGHEAGDDALVQLSRTVRNSLRPTDVLARLAGQEFVILMPDTPIEVAVGQCERLQRQLTREFFLQGMERLFVTFSAGVTQVRPDEAQQAAIDRAGQGLAHAKRLGKNRVCAS